MPIEHQQVYALDDEEDAFWAIALSTEPRHRNFSDADDNDDDDFCDSNTAVYRVEDVDLHLSSLPESSGAWSPVGAQIWHASAVLACLPFNFDSFHTVLEIGSGAVGLSGLALAVRMKEQSKLMILSDVDEGIMDQLQSNVNLNTAKVLGDKQDAIHIAQVQVEEIDWRAAAAIDVLPPLDLIVGSELVYTDETSAACALLLKNLLARNRQARVVIIQVFDRPGWSEFLSFLSDKAIRIVQPLPPEWHDRAVKMIRKEALGTLSRDDYGLCLIANVGVDLDCVLYDEE
jgi:predicted nicotinamide N-methyase